MKKRRYMKKNEKNETIKIWKILRDLKKKIIHKNKNPHFCLIFQKYRNTKKLKIQKMQTMQKIRMMNIIKNI